MSGACIQFQIDFESMTVLSVTEARLLEDREQRQRRFNEEKLKKIESEINGIDTIYLLFFSYKLTLVNLLRRTRTGNNYCG